MTKVEIRGEGKIEFAEVHDVAFGDLSIYLYKVDIIDKNSNMFYGSLIYSSEDDINWYKKSEMESLCFTRSFIHKVIFFDRASFAEARGYVSLIAKR